MKTLNFKNVGQYAEELSSRYVAKISKNLQVRVWKCAYSKSWRFEFITINGYGLDRETGNFLSCICSIEQGSKKNMIMYIQDCLNENQFEGMDETAKRIDDNMRQAGFIK